MTAVLRDLSYMKYHQYILVLIIKNFRTLSPEPNRVLVASPPDIDISPLQSLLPRSVRTTLTQLHSGHCRLLNKARIISGISDVCPDSVEHSVQLSKPSDATYSARPVGQPACGRRLSQPGQLMIGEELLGYNNNNNNQNPPWHAMQTCSFFAFICLTE